VDSGGIAIKHRVVCQKIYIEEANDCSR